MFQGPKENRQGVGRGPVPVLQKSNQFLQVRGHPPTEAHPALHVHTIHHHDWVPGAPALRHRLPYPRPSRPEALSSVHHQEGLGPASAPAVPMHPGEGRPQKEREGHPKCQEAEVGGSALHPDPGPGRRGEEADRGKDPPLPGPGDQEMEDQGKKGEESSGQQESRAKEFHQGRADSRTHLRMRGRRGSSVLASLQATPFRRASRRRRW